MFEAVALTNFKGLQQNATLPLGQFTLMVGCKGSGKSTAVQGFAAHFLSGDRWSYDSVKRHGLQPERGVSSHARWKEAGNEWYGRLCWSKDSRDAKGRHYLYPISGEADGMLAALRNAFFLDPIAMAEKAWLKNCCPYLDPDGRNLARMLKILQQEGLAQFRDLSREFIQWMPQFAEIELLQPQRGYRAIAFRDHQGGCIPAADLPRGPLLILGLLSLRYFVKASMIALDEPDAGLTVAQKLMLRDWLVRVAFPNSSCGMVAPIQVALSTGDLAFAELFDGQPATVVPSQWTAYTRCARFG